jgi:hypothetical protein
MVPNDTSNTYTAAMANRALYTHSNFIHDSRPPLESLQFALGPVTLDNYQQTSPFLQHNHDNTSNCSHLPTLQQLNFQPTPLEITSCHASIPDMRAFDEQIGPDYLGVLPRADGTPIPFVQNGGLPPHYDARDLQISSANRSGPEIMAASAASVVPVDHNPFSHNVSTMVSQTPDHGTSHYTIIADPHRTHHNLVVGGGHKRALSPTDADHDLSVSHGVSNDTLGDCHQSR